MAKAKYVGTLCWKCDNGYADKCEWIRIGQPIQGWTARPTIIQSMAYANGVRYSSREPSFKVAECPNYSPSTYKPKPVQVR